MQRHTIETLNTINQEFYARISAQFSATRSYAWQGWDVLWQKIATQLAQYPPCILDVGCGNGRFAQYLTEKDIPFTYLGIDQNQDLLNLAEQNTRSNLAHNAVQFRHVNLVDSLLDETLIDDMHGQKFTLIALFGVLHHIPSFTLRQRLLQTLSSALSPGGLLVLSCWRFDRNTSVFSRSVDPREVGVDPDHLEAGDYFLTWERGVYAVRYCHLTLPAEQDELIRGTNLRYIDRFSADGKTGMDNDYLILTAKSNT